MAPIGWIDFSSEHRDKVRTVIDLLRKKGVIDELGIGVIRDSFADRMFPGISTIQTRAKYFTLTALLIREYLDLPRIEKEKLTLEAYFREREKDCRIQLVQRYGSSAESLGIFGVSFGESTDRDVLRPPSSAYWNGLRVFGFVRTRLSLSEFSRKLSKPQSLQDLLQATSHLKGDDLDADPQTLPTVRVPQISTNYWDDLAITLTATEAEFLKQQITSKVPTSFLGQILLDDEATDQVVQLEPNARFVDLAELPFVKDLGSIDLKRTISHARDFWKILRGAHIRYNWLLQKRFGQSSLLATRQQDWEAWVDEMQQFDWAQWNTDFLWEVVEQHGSKPKADTRNFVNGWIQQARSATPNTAACDELVSFQERAIKGPRARLRPYAKDVDIGEWVGLKGLDFRFSQVRDLVRDIRRGESGEADPDAGR